MKIPLPLLLSVALLGCSTSSSEPGEKARASMPSVAQLSQGLVEEEFATEERVMCREQLAQVRDAAQLEGAPTLEGRRSEILALSKGEPVLFLREPKQEPTDRMPVRVYRRQLAGTRFPADVIQRLLGHFTFMPSDGAAVLLRDGYVYANSDRHARALVDKVQLHHLFDAPQLRILRGGATILAERDPLTRKYTYTSGHEKGKKARVLLFDRIAPADAPIRPPLHVDVRTLQYELGFERMKIERLTEQGIIAHLRYRDFWIPSLLRVDGTHLKMQCELVEESQRESLLQTRNALSNRLRLLYMQRQAILAQVEEMLPFDEPKTEYGQQDGKLRERWLQAYDLGFHRFHFQGDYYPVFTLDGRPAVPQVCVDFLTDTFERASGAWWANRGEPRQRRPGRIDFRGLEMRNSRSIDDFVSFVRDKPEWFEFWEIPATDRIEFRRGAKFMSWLTAHTDDFAPGDIVIIRGYTPRDRQRIMHYHSFFIYEMDPITGMPMLIAGNAGRPMITSWLRELLRTPERSIWYRVRPRTEWLESVIEVPDSIRAIPVWLTAGLE